MYYGTDTVTVVCLIFSIRRKNQDEKKKKKNQITKFLQPKQKFSSDVHYYTGVSLSLPIFLFQL